MKLEIKNLHAKIVENNQVILNGVNLTINKGEMHAFMGPNGSGKSTLAGVIMGNPEYEVTKGQILLDDKNILDLDVTDRAKLGIFLAFQYPTEIPGVPIQSFLLKAYNNIHNTKISPREFLNIIKTEAKNLDISNNLLSRSLNEGFSGGEKKKLEIMQLKVLKPNFAIFDETDSGLDVDSLKTVAKNINDTRKKLEFGSIVITHYNRILDHLNPDFVHIFKNGKIIKSGNKNLADKLENEGYKIYEE